MQCPTVIRITMIWGILGALVTIAIALFVMVTVRDNRRFRLQQSRRREAASSEKSPHPFISDEVWREWRVKAGAQLGVGPPALEMELVQIAEDVKARIATRPFSGPQPSPGSIADCARQLLEIKCDSFLLGAGDWPVCCGRLATIVSTHDLAAMEARFGPLDDCAVGDGSDAWPVQCQAWRNHPLSGQDGLAYFQCRGCGRPYVAFHEP